MKFEMRFYETKTYVLSWPIEVDYIFSMVGSCIQYDSYML